MIKQWKKKSKYLILYYGTEGVVKSGRDGSPDLFLSIESINYLMDPHDTCVILLTLCTDSTVVNLGLMLLVWWLGRSRKKCNAADKLIITMRNFTANRNNRISEKRTPALKICTAILKISCYPFFFYLSKYVFCICVKNVKL